MSILVRSTRSLTMMLLWSMRALDIFDPCGCLRTASSLALAVISSKEHFQSNKDWLRNASISNSRLNMMTASPTNLIHPCSHLCLLFILILDTSHSLSSNTCLLLSVKFNNPTWHTPTYALASLLSTRNFLPIYKKKFPPLSSN